MYPPQCLRILPRKSLAPLFGNQFIVPATGAVVRTAPGASSAFAERAAGAYYLNIEPDRMALARLGLERDVLARAETHLSELHHSLERTLREAERQRTELEGLYPLWELTASPAARSPALPRPRPRRPGG